MQIPLTASFTFSVMLLPESSVVAKRKEKKSTQFPFALRLRGFCNMTGHNMWSHRHSPIQWCHTTISNAYEKLGHTEAPGRHME